MPLIIPRYEPCYPNTVPGKTPYEQIMARPLWPLSEYLSHPTHGSEVAIMLEADDDAEIQALTLATLRQLTVKIEASSHPKVSLYSHEPEAFPPELNVTLPERKTFFMCDLAFIVRGKYVQSLRARHSPSGHNADLEA